MTWQQLIQSNATSAEELREVLHLTDREVEKMEEEIARFPMSVTHYYLSLIDPADPEDPIRKMSVPSGNVILSEGELDTSGEYHNTKLKGLQHKYSQTALVLTTSDCAMYCRHCFRRRLVGLDNEEIAEDIDSVVGYLEQHPEITNVLLSGGDSFLMPDERIEEWLRRLVALPQLDFIRFGTRTPVTFPQRILEDPGLRELLTEYARKKQIYVVTHFNHPHEVTEQSRAAVDALRQCGIVVKNQTVLMRGINDSAQILGQLLREITSMGVVQHYIFQCRPVQGVKSHFQVPLAEGNRIVQEALAMQNGLGKTADLTMSHVTGKIRILGRDEEGRMLFQYKQAKDPSRAGRIFTYPVDEKTTWLPDSI